MDKAVRTDEEARLLYDQAACRAYSPAWDKLGDVTKAVWRERTDLPYEGPKVPGS